MERKIIVTNDGSKTLFLEDWNETYHSKNGAIIEALHVFIKNGLSDEIFIKKRKIKILEIGFGTGLNALLTAHFSKEFGFDVEYIGLEKYPITKNEFDILDYPDAIENVLNKKINDLTIENQTIFDAEWNNYTTINNNFKIKKLEMDFFDLNQIEDQNFDLVYFDAFGSRVQPELWEEDLLKLVIDKMSSESIFVTYAAKGSLKRALKKYELSVEKRPGPPGKREMMVGRKITIKPNN